MTSPTPTKTWQFDLNISVPAQASEVARAQEMLFAIKEAMVGFASNPWTVALSSNTSTASAGDNWTTPADLVWSTGTARSWIVLENSTGFQMLFDLRESTSSANQMDLYVSTNGGFTGGTTAATPTSPGQVTFSTSLPWFNNPVNASHQSYANVMHSDDGNQTWVVLNSEGVNQAVWCINTPSNSVAQWVDPRLVAFHVNPTVDYDNDMFKGSTRCKANFEAVDTWASAFGYTLTRDGATQPASKEQSSVSGVTGAHQLCPVWIGANSPLAVSGVHGLIDDFYLIHPSAASPGDTLPLAGPPEWVKLDDWIVPWTGGAMLF